MRHRIGQMAARAVGRSTIEVLLYGRDPERSIIGGLLEGARESRSGVLVIRGEAGVGKSALLEDARERGADMRVLACAGVEAESALPFAGLHQLLRPVLRHLEKVPEPQADALRGALGLAAGRGDDRFLVSLAVLSVLAEAAEQRPLLCLVDDAHWLDDASADALVFVARRLEAEGIVLLFSAREGEAREFDAPELAELRLAGLDADAAAALLDRHADIALSPETRARLVEATGGHPLALLELPLTLSEGQLAGVEPLLTPLPVSARPERHSWRSSATRCSSCGTRSCGPPSTTGRRFPSARPCIAHWRACSMATRRRIDAPGTGRRRASAPTLRWWRSSSRRPCARGGGAASSPPRWHTNGPPRSHRTNASARGCSPLPPKTPGSAGGSSAHGCCWSGHAPSLRSRCNVRTSIATSVSWS